MVLKDDWRVLLSFVWIYFLCFPISYAQNNILDSRPELEPNKEKVDFLAEDSYEFIDEGKKKENYDTAEWIANYALQLSDTIGYRIGTSKALSRLGTIALLRDRNDSLALHHFKGAYKIRKEEMKKDPSYSLLIVRSVNSIMSAYLRSNGLDSVVYYGIEGLAILENIAEQDDAFFEVKAKVHNTLGAAYRRKGLFYKAMDHLELGLTIRRELNSIKDLANSLLNIGNLNNESYLGDYDKAIRSFEEGVILADSIENQILRGEHTLGLGNAYYNKGLFEEAEKYYLELIDLEGEISWSTHIWALQNLGNVYYSKKDYPKAIEQYKKCENILGKYQKGDQYAATQIFLGWSYLLSEQEELALPALESGVELIGQLKDQTYLSFGLKGLARYYADKKDYSNAYQYSNEYIAIDSTEEAEGKQALILKANLEETRGEVATLEADRTKKENRVVKLQRNLSFVGIAFLLGVILFGLYVMANRKKRQQLEIQLRERIAREEKEEIVRAQISEDLHDNLGGNLATIQKFFENLRKKLNLAEKALEDQYNKAINLLEESYQDVRRISKDLKEGTLYENGIESAVENFVNLVQENADIEIELDFFGLEESLNPDIEQAIFFIIKESVTNATKYAEPKNIDIQLGVAEEMVNILIEDNGKGFDPSIVKKRKSKTGGLGLQNMRSRVEVLNGKFNIDSKENRGTTIIASIPIDK